MLQNTQAAQRAELERLSVNHPLRESYFTYSLRNCDMEVSPAGFKLITFYSLVSKNGPSAYVSFLGRGALLCPLKEPFFFHPFFNLYLETLQA